MEDRTKSTRRERQNRCPTSNRTDTTSALREAREKSFTPAYGARSNEQAFPRIAVLITDGFPYYAKLRFEEAANFSLLEADLLKNAGVKLLAVGVGSEIDEKFLQSVASAPTCTHVFMLTDYMELALAFQTELKIRICEDVPPEASDSTDVHCTASGAFTFARQTSLSTYQVPANGTTVRVCARGILHAFFSRSKRSPGPAAFDQFVSVENLNASARVCKQVQLRNQATGERVYFTLMGKDSDGPVAFDTDCFEGVRGGTVVLNISSTLYSYYLT